jgi:tricarballylate dehydrogenase
MPTVFPPFKGDSIEALASQLSLPAERVVATVRAFNQAVRPGSFDHAVMDDCRTEGVSPEKTHWAQTIDAPPYYGYPLRPGITFTYLGVKVNEKANVLMKSGALSKNMYAAGEIMAGNILGKGYLAGFGMTIGTVFGRIAGQQAAIHARP